MSYVVPVMQILIAAMVMTAGVYDIRYRRVPNWLTLTGFLAGIGLNWFLFGIPGLMWSAKGTGIALLIYFPLFAIRAMGAGDAKLMAALGAMVGPWNWLGIFFFTGIMGGLFALILLLSTGRTRQTLANVGFLVGELAYFRAPYMKNETLDVRHPRAVGLPHAAVIALASLAFLAAASIWAPR